MADYYSILKKTIASLPESNGAVRRSVYSRARSAIVNQLKAYKPPLSPSEITSEQLRLEEAIRKVEAEAARASLGLEPAVSETPTVKTPTSPASATATISTGRAPSAEAPLKQSASVPTAPSSVASEASDSSVPSPLKETLSEAQALGTAANKAIQNVKDVAQQPAQKAEPSVSELRQEPAFTESAADETGIFESIDLDASESASAGLISDEPTDPNYSDMNGSGNGRAKNGKPSASDALRAESGVGRILPIALAGVLTLGVLGAGAYFLLSGDDTAEVASDAPSSQVASVPATQPEPVQPEAVPEKPVTPVENGSEKNNDRLINNKDADVVAPDARTVKTTTINPEPSEDVAPSQPSIVTNVESTPAPVDPVPVPDTDTPADAAASLAAPENNLAAVAPEDNTPSAPAATEEGTVQRAILYEEGKDSGGAGTAAQGAVEWALNEETGLDGKAHAVLSASVEVPERDVKVEIRFKSNDDTSLPASHLVEIKYEFPDEFTAGDVVNVPGLVMKPTEEARGDALIGASVKVSPGYFWIALSSLPNEQQRNLALLRERGWIDIPMLYENGKRGILTIEKGSIGTDAVEKAVAAWQAG
ncbi:MAG: hypothetical protein ABJN98_05455 [Roseibium sp.]